MILRREAIEERLKKLDEILEELSKYRDIGWEDFQASLSQRWVVERGLIAAASMIFEIADHILAGYFASYAETYEESLERLVHKGVLSEKLYQQVKGLGGFRNILIHGYLDINPRVVFENFHKALDIFPRFAQEILM